MTNSYYKLLSTKINNKCKEDVFSGLQHDLKSSIKKEESDDLYSVINNLKTTNVRELDINLLLKYYMLNQIMGDKNINNEVPKLFDTANKLIKRDRTGKYFTQKDGTYEIDESILKVNNDGSYIVSDKRSNKSITILRTYNKDNQITSIKVTDSSGNSYTNKNIVAEIIGLKKEYKKRYKYSGYSGKSMDVVTSLRNMFSSPIETGCYMDFHCLLYRWHSSLSSYVRVFDNTLNSPLLVDIEFRDNGTVIRQEYTGIVA